MNQHEIEVVAQDHGVRPKLIVHGLDALRFITAMWVAFSHGARFPIEKLVLPEGALNKFLYLMSKTAFNGTAAVAVFFLISGFLIHGGNVGKPFVDKKKFLIRRGVRIGLPLVVILILARFLGESYWDSLDHVTWTVYCEIIYYFIYPFIVPFFCRYGAIRILIFSIISSLIIVTLNFESIYLWSFGIYFNWLFCAPLWLMGCAMAENRDLIAKYAINVPVWIFRIGVIAYCIFSTIIAHHLSQIHIGYTWTIFPFGIFCMFWLIAEIDFGTGLHRISLLERFGLAGYSLYLVHKLVINFFLIHVSQGNPILIWLALIAAILVVAWAFYRLVEWPAHNLARQLGRSG